jgi:hypothetical protein
VARDSKSAKTEPYIVVDVTDVKSVGAIAYPAAGTFRQRGIDNLPQVDYQFQVLSAESVPELNRAEWFPEWPKGTIVVDQINNKNISIPHDERTLTEAKLRKLAESPPRKATWSSGRVAFLMINIAAIVALSVYAWRRWRHPHHEK